MAPAICSLSHQGAPYPSETWPDGSTHHNVVQSWERYDHFFVTTGFRADPNPLHDLPHCNLNQISHIIM